MILYNLEGRICHVKPKIYNNKYEKLKKNNSKLTNLKSMIALAISFPKKQNFILTFAI